PSGVHGASRPARRVRLSPSRLRQPPSSRTRQIPVTRSAPRAARHLHSSGNPCPSEFRVSAKIQPKASKLPWIIVTLLIAAMIAAGGWVWYSSAAAAESPNAADSVDGDDSAENPKAAP